MTQEEQKPVHGGDIYRNQNVTDFSVNSNPLGPPEAVTEALRRCVAEIVHYPDVRCQRLKEAISRWEGVGLEEILCGNGAAELFFAAVWAARPRKALLTAPAFAEYERALRAAGAQIVFHDLKETQEFCIDEEFERKITSQIDLVFLCSPNNPTGQPVEKERVRRILERCQECGAVLILDECFVDFLDEPERFEAMGLRKTYPNLVIVKAFTKIFAMPGLRLGYAVCADPEFLRKMGETLQPWNVSLMAQEGGVAAISQAEEYVAATRRAVARGRTYLRDNLERLGFRVYGSHANYLFFKGKPGLYERALEAGFLIRDCGNYRGLEAGFYRIAVRTPEENARWIEWLKQS